MPDTCGRSFLGISRLQYHFLREAVIGKTGLKVLYLLCGGGKYGGGKTGGNAAFSDAEGIMRMLQCLPKLKDVSYDDFRDVRNSINGIVPFIPSNTSTSQTALSLQILDLTAAFPLTAKDSIFS